MFHLATDFQYAALHIVSTHAKLPLL